MDDHATDERPGHRVRTPVDEDSAAKRASTWAAARASLDGLPGGGLNIAHEAVTRHAAGPRADHPALVLVQPDGSARVMSYRHLDEESNRFARLLAALGVNRGDRVFVATGRRAELYLAALGTWKAGAVFCPLFAAFGPEPMRQRISAGRGAVVVTTPTLYQRRIAPIRAELPDLRTVLCTGGADHEGGVPDGTEDLDRLLGATSGEPFMVDTSAEDPAIVHFTSGTTGQPKGALHVHEAVVAHRATVEWALGLGPDDVFWCTADPGWVTGTSYGIVAPLAVGATNVVDLAEFDAERWYQILADQRVNVWYTAPTAIRMLMRLGSDVARRYDTSALRTVASVGEPLDPSGVSFGEAAFGRPVHDTWWQTETGGIMIANAPAEPVRPGSMGRPLPGVEAAVLATDDEGEVALDADGFPCELGPGSEGMLALRPGWPSMFRTYLDAEERYRRCFLPSRDGGSWYLSGDLVRADGDGWYWFVARADDVIKTAGHLIGPFEVESALATHHAVAASAVFGKPDEVAGAVVKAVVVLRAGVEPSDSLRRELIAHARRRLGPAVAPREIDFAPALPSTRSGKIMRRLLRARELGLPEGDTSTLEPVS